MTPEQIEIHRKRFESLCDSSFIRRFPSGTYHWSFMRERWDGYLLCAENMPAVELPEPIIGDYYLEGYVGYVNVVEKLESQGYTVKSR